MSDSLHPYGPRERPHLVTVCDACLCASCWHGEFLCEKGYTAGVTEISSEKLDLLGLEHSDHYSRRVVLETCGEVVELRDKIKP